MTAVIDRDCCGYSAPLDRPWSEWHRGHQRHHLATYPDSDSQTVVALEDIARWAEEREAEDQS